MNEADISQSFEDIMAGNNMNPEFVAAASNTAEQGLGKAALSREIVPFGAQLMQDLPKEYVEQDHQATVPTGHRTSSMVKGKSVVDDAQITDHD